MAARRGIMRKAWSPQPGRSDARTLGRWTEGVVWGANHLTARADTNNAVGGGGGGGRGRGLGREQI